MFSIKITFKSLNVATLSFLVSSKNKELIEEFLFSLHELFGDVENKKITALQRNSTEVNTMIHEIVENFRPKFGPTLNQLSSWFRKLEPDAYFYFLPGIELSLHDHIRTHNQLKSLAEGIDFEKLNEDSDSLYGRLLENYEFAANGIYRKFIGAKEKSRRVCRFCGKGASEVTFRNTAHAISEALGNKKVFLYEECDQCNDRFSIEIEPDAIDHFSIFRVFFDIRGKGGRKKIKGQNFEMKNDGNVKIDYTKNGTPPERTLPYNLNLELKSTINPQDVYRCLCKFFISVVDDKALPNFVKTIEWINRKITSEKLPPIAETISYQHFSLEPKLFVYIRKNDNRDIPYAVGEFHFTCTITVFIIPFATEDEKDFSKEDDYSLFWKNFEHYKRTINWAFNDYSDDWEKNTTFKLKGDVRDGANQ